MPEAYTSSLRLQHAARAFNGLLSLCSIESQAWETKLARLLADGDKQHSTFNKKTPSVNMTALEQGSEAWFAARKGRLTASNFGVACGLSKHSTPASYWQKVTGRVDEEMTAEQKENTHHGNMMEPRVRQAYETLTGMSVEEHGFYLHPSHSWLGASPDGLVGSDGLVEIKCPRYAMHDEIPAHYMAQIQGQMEVIGKTWCDFVCFLATADEEKGWDCGICGELRNTTDTCAMCGSKPSQSRSSSICNNSSGSGSGPAAGDRGELLIIRVQRSKHYWQWMMSRLSRFWTAVQADIEPSDEDLPCPPDSPAPAVTCTVHHRGRVILFLSEHKFQVWLVVYVPLPKESLHDLGRPRKSVEYSKCRLS